MKKNKILLGLLFRRRKGITGLETAIILIAFVVVAAVFAYTTLSAGLFSTGKAGEAVYSGLQEVQSSIDVRGDVVGFRDTLNSSGQGSLGKVEFTATLLSSGNPANLTPAYSINPGNGALINSSPGANWLQIAFTDQNVTIPDCAWTIVWSGMTNGDHLLDSNEKAIITVWLHTFDGTNWGPAGAESPPFLGNNYVDTYHKFVLEVKSTKGAISHLERTTPGYLDPVVDLH
jgi:archaeal flagellin FlaB